MNEIPSEAIRLLRDVDAYVVPSGDEVKLLAGNLVRITQALGGNYTVIMNGNMVQITAENADALGFEISEPDTNAPSANVVTPLTLTLLRSDLKVVTPVISAPVPNVTGPLNDEIPAVVKSPELVKVFPAATVTPCE